MADISEKNSNASTPDVVEGVAGEKLSPEEPVARSAPVAQHGPKSGADAALQLLQETGGLHQALDPEVNRRLVRRIDKHIMPLICIIWSVSRQPP